MGISLKVFIFATWWLGLVGLVWGAEPEGLLLYNQQVPLSKSLVDQYQKLHPEAVCRVMSIDVSPMETISEEIFKDKVASVLLKNMASEGVNPSWVLSFYGLPLWVKGAQRLRSFDQMLSILPLRQQQPQDLGRRLVLNPFFFGESADASPWKVSRLDGPALRHVERVLESWVQLKYWGGFRRCFLQGHDGELGARFALAGHLVYPSSWSREVELRELQLLESNSRVELLSFLKQRSEDELLGPGAIAVQYHQAMFDADAKVQLKPLSFRRGRSGMAHFAMRGGAFFVGSEAPKNRDEDLFDLSLFSALYLKGQTFVDSVYASMPNLGGAMVVLGDPLARPYHPTWEKEREMHLNASDADGRSEAYLQALKDSRDWWLVRDYLKYWEDARFKMVMNLLKVALARHQSPLFMELMGRCLFQMEGTEAVRRFWSRWPEKSKGSWQRFLAQTSWGLSAAETAR